MMKFFMKYVGAMGMTGSAVGAILGQMDQRMEIGNRRANVMEKTVVWSTVGMMVGPVLPLLVGIGYYCKDENGEIEGVWRMSWRQKAMKGLS